MRIAKINIHNMLGIEHLEIQPGSLTVISGKNNTGKTSTMKAIQALTQGGHDATLLRRGQKEGETVFLLEDGSEIRKRVTEGESSVTVTSPAGLRQKAPQSLVNRLTDALSVNPVAILTAAPKDRLKFVLEAIPLRVTEADLMEAIPDVYVAIDAGDLDRHALEVIGTLAKTYYDDRTGLNRTVKEKRATVAQLRDSLPDAAAPSPAARIEEIEEALTDLDREKLDRHESATEAADRERAEIREAAEKRVEELRAEIERVKEAAAGNMILVDQALQRVLLDLHNDFEPKKQALKQEQSALEEQAKEAERHANTHSVIAKMDTEADGLEERAQMLTAALASLDELKGNLLEQLPIEAVEIQDGEIYRGGIPFHRWNTAEQMKLVFEIARLRAGDLGLVCVDGLECLDPEAFEAFCRQAEADEKLHFVVTRVTGEPFKIETTPKPEPAVAHA